MGKQTSEQKINQREMGEIFRRCRGAERRVMCSQGPWKGPPIRGSEKRLGRRAVLLKIPALPETTDPAATNPAPSLPTTPQLIPCQTQLRPEPIREG